MFKLNFVKAQINLFQRPEWTPSLALAWQFMFVYKPNLISGQLSQLEVLFLFVSIVCRSSAKWDIFEIKKKSIFQKIISLVLAEIVGLFPSFLAFKR